MNNKPLLITLIALLGLFLLTKFWRANASSSFDPVLSSIDTTRIDLIRATTLTDGEPFELRRVSSAWEAIRGDKRIPVASTKMQGLLGPLTQLEAKRIVSTTAERHAEYEVTDEMATRLEVFQGKKRIADLLVGGFRFDQVARTASGYMRKSGKPEVYLIDGFVTISLKTRFDQFREKHLLHMQAEDLTSLEWNDHAGRKEVITKEDGLWHYAGMEAVDSSAFASYLNGLVKAQGAGFSELTSTKGLIPVESITLYGHNMTEPALIRVFYSDDPLSPWLIHSNGNPEAIFTSDSLGLYQKIFKDLRTFWPDGQ